VTLQAVFTGPEEVIVAAKVRPRLEVSADALTTAIDDLDGQLRAASEFVADVYLDVTKHRREDVVDQ